MSTLKVPGATLYYETEGSGQPLILIPGANGDGFIFMPISQFLKDKFTVVRYDRRGYSRSELDAPLGPEYHDQDCLLRLKEDAADVAALIRELDAGPAVVFGSSSGAQVALQVLIDYPELVDTLFCHEVPLLRTFEDFPEWEKKFLNLHTIFKEKGVGPAMFAFVQAISAGEDAGNFQETAAAAGGPYAAKNMDFWFEFELRQYSRYPMDFEALDRSADKLVLVNGEDSGGKMPAHANEYFAKKYGKEVVIAPNRHFGYAEKPAEFAKVLLKVLA